MGFFDRLTKFFQGKKKPEIARPAQSRPSESTPPVTQPNVKPVAPIAGNGHHQLSEKTAGLGAAVAVEELPQMPEMIGSSEAPLAPFTEPASGDFFSDDFDQDLDDAFALLVSQDPISESHSPSAEMIANDRAAVENLFAVIAANYVRPVKNFIFELKRGTATKEWIDICRPAMHGITRAAEGMGMGPAAKRMADFEAALSLAQGSEQRVLNGEIRDHLLWCYEDLVKVMPQAFVVEEEEQQREGIIINSLLMQIPNLGQVTVQKLYRAGLTSLDTLFLAKKDDLAVAAGIPAWLSERICEKFQSYRVELEGNSRDVADAGQRSRLSEMVADLRSQHEGLQRASEDAGSPEVLASEKREYRRQRQSTLHRINVVLAEMGELDLVDELKKLSFARRIQCLEGFLASPSAAM